MRPALVAVFFWHWCLSPLVVICAFLSALEYIQDKSLKGCAVWAQAGVKFNYTAHTNVGGVAAR